MNIKKIITVLLIASALAAGFWIFKFSNTPAAPNIPVTEYSLLNKVIVANLGKHFIINFRPLREEIEKIQVKYPQKTYVYFSYINNGAWIGLNEREEFTAASTIKVPLAMSVYKIIEDGKLKLTDSYSLEELDLDSNFGELYKVGSDKEFTVEELIKIMLEQSDNTAMNAIYNILSRLGIEDSLGDVYNELGWQFLTPPALDETPDYQKINLKTLANMFSTLYNAAYVNPEHSEQILTYLSNTPFKNKIVAGVPKDIAVSHKIGVSSLDETFSDCGIIYAPNRNYLLCLGSNGGNEKVAAEFMAEISKATYNYVINN